MIDFSKIQPDYLLEVGGREYKMFILKVYGDNFSGLIEDKSYGIEYFYGTKTTEKMTFTACRFTDNKANLVEEECLFYHFLLKDHEIRVGEKVEGKIIAPEGKNLNVCTIQRL